MIRWEDIAHSRIDAETRKPYFTVLRAKISGGWLVMFFKLDGGKKEVTSMSWAWGAGCGGMTFVPDPDHDWDGNSLP